MHTIDVLTWYISNNMLLCRPHKEILAPDQKATPSTNGPTINDINILGGGVKKWGNLKIWKDPEGGGIKMGEKTVTFIMDGPQPSMLPFETNFCQAGSRKLFTTAHASATEMMARKLRYSKPPWTKPSPLCVAFWPVGSHNTMFTYLYFLH